MKEYSAVEGGIEFRGKLDDCYKANLHLRIPTRILMRIREFRATNFRRLEKSLMIIPWELYIQKNISPVIKVTSKHSRLYHKEAIAERLLKSIAVRSGDLTTSSSDDTDTSKKQNIFVRVVDDIFTLSIDSSGEALYKRGIKKHGGPAPIRETLASAALILAEYRSDEPLLDPMCGTGTFSVEAGMISNNIPPGWYRDFAFENWPGFRRKRWEYLKKNAEMSIMSPAALPHIISCDLNSSFVKSLHGTVEKYIFKNSIRTMNKDFFNITPGDIFNITGNNKKGLVIINPPYGVRLGTKYESRELADSILNRLKQLYAGWKIALFIHDKIAPKKIFPACNLTPLDHGGLRLSLLTGIIPGNRDGHKRI